MKRLEKFLSLFLLVTSVSGFATSGLAAATAELAKPCPAKSADWAKWALLVDTSKPETIAPAMEALTCALEKCHPGLLTVYRDQDQRTIEVVGVTSRGQCGVKVSLMVELGRRNFACDLPKGTAPWLGLLEDDPLSGLPLEKCRRLDRAPE